MHDCAFQTMHTCICASNAATYKQHRQGCYWLVCCPLILCRFRQVSAISQSATSYQWPCYQTCYFPLPEVQLLLLMHSSASAIWCCCAERRRQHGSSVAAYNSVQPARHLHNALCAVPTAGQHYRISCQHQTRAFAEEPAEDHSCAPPCWGVCESCCAW